MRHAGIIPEFDRGIHNRKDSLLFFYIDWRRMLSIFEKTRSFTGSNGLGGRARHKQRKPRRAFNFLTKGIRRVVATIFHFDHHT